MDKQQGPTIPHRELPPISCDKSQWKRILKIIFIATIYIYESLCYRTDLKQHCKSSILQLNEI